MNMTRWPRNGNANWNIKTTANIRTQKLQIQGLITARYVCKSVFQYLFISFCYFSEQSFPTNVCEKVSVREPVEECRELPREACHLQQRQTPDERCQLVTREECTTVQEVVPVTQCQDVTITLCQETPSDTGNNSGNQQVCTSTDYCSNWGMG